MNTLHSDVFVTGIHRLLALITSGLTFSCETTVKDKVLFLS